MRNITITNISPANESKNRLQKIATFSEKDSISCKFFSWVCIEHPLTFHSTVYDKVYFEVKFPLFNETSENESAEVYSKMDIVLISDDCMTMLCFVSSNTKHTHHQAAIFKGAYFKPSCYYKDNPYRTSFIKYALRYNEKKNGYFAGIKQNISHIIGITNILHDADALAWFKANNPFIEPEVLAQINQNTEIIFTNLLYYCPEIGTDIYGDIHAEEKTYPYLLAEFLFDHLQNNLDEPLLLSRFITTYPELFAEIQSQMPNGLAEYLDNKYILTNHA